MLLAQVAVLLGYGSTEGNDASGGVPALDNLVEQAFAGVRRLFTPGAANVAPTAKPSEVYQYDSGEVIGDIRATDVDGDNLTYTVLDGPKNGQLVKINSNGTYLYHADTDFMAVGGADAFTVAIDDGSGRAPVSVIVPVTVTPTLGFSRGYHVDNLVTGAQSVQITNIGGDTNGYKGQGVGFVLPLAQRTSWETREDVWVTQEVGITFTATNGVGFRVTTYVPPGIGSGSPQIRCTTQGGACDPGGGGFVRSQGASLLDEDPVNIVIDASDLSQAERAGDDLAALCFNGSVAKCTFKAISQVRATGLEHQFGAAQNNPPDAPNNATGSITKGYMASESDNIQIQVKASGGALTNLLSVINLEITATYGHTWTKTETFSQTVNFNTPPGKTETWYVADPVYRVTGNFVVSAGNTTITINNAKFDTPRTDGLSPGPALTRRFTDYSG